MRINFLARAYQVQTFEHDPVVWSKPFLHQKHAPDPCSQLNRSYINCIRIVNYIDLVKSLQFPYTPLGDHQAIFNDFHNDLHPCKLTGSQQQFWIGK